MSPEGRIRQKERTKTPYLRGFLVVVTVLIMNLFYNSFVTYFNDAPKPKILLINFLEKDKKIFEDAGYFVDLGYLGGLNYFQGNVISADYYHMPHPSYEYDIFIFSTDLPEDGKKYKIVDPNEKRRAKKDLSDIRDKINKTNSYLICFIGNENVENNDLSIIGFADIKLRLADKRDSKLEYHQSNTFVVKELNDVLFRFKDKLKEVNRYIVYENRYTDLNLWGIPVFKNQKGEVVCQYCSYFLEKIGSLPSLILLPEFEDDPKVAVKIVNCLADIIPNVYSNSVNNKIWIEDPVFVPQEVFHLKSEIISKKNEFKLFKKNKLDEIKQEKEKWGFMTQILTADDENFDGDERLSVNIKKSFEYLGFKVLIENENQGGKRNEDLIIEDENDNYEALIEVKGTISQNPPESYYSQILKHLKKSNNSNARGLLIINFDYNKHPFERGMVYADSADLFSDDPDDIGVLSTVELFKILKAVKDKLLSKEEARKIIKQPNRILFKSEK